MNPLSINKSSVRLSWVVAITHLKTASVTLESSCSGPNVAKKHKLSSDPQFITASVFRDSEIQLRLNFKAILQMVFQSFLCSGEYFISGK